MRELSKENWDAAYADGKYKNEAPIPFVQDIVGAVQAAGLEQGRGLYPGCGNGRNFIALADAGLRLTGLDISEVAVAQLRDRQPGADVRVGDFLDLATEEPYDYLLSIQLFQHCTAHGNMRAFFDKTHKLLRPGGLFALRVNSIHTTIVERHKIIEQQPSGSFTVQYESGPKTGQAIHFYSAEELRDLTAGQYNIQLPLREAFMQRQDGSQWAQWETILQKR